MEAEIRRVRREELDRCLEVIHESFRTAAEEFHLTRENCPKHTSFMPKEYLSAQMDWGWQMFALHEKGRIVGYVSVSEKGDGLWEMHNLAVLPECRHRGYGTRLLEHAKDCARTAGGRKMAIGIIEESARLKAWYEAKGFISVGTKKFEHLPFTTGFMECAIGPIARRVGYRE